MRPLRTCLLLAALLPTALRAQGQAPEEITVIGTSPLIGAGLDRNLVPGSTQVLGSADIARNGTPDLLAALDTQVAGVNLDSASGNPFQPSLFYHGFSASPLQGTSQGLAVYLNGIRFNQAFGDTVNWDLIPDIAIAKLQIEGSNPVFGLNALGGSLSARLRDGFGYQGIETDVSGGSFGQVQGEFQYGRQFGQDAVYLAGSALHQGGWRDLQSSDIQNFYADLGARRGGLELHANLNLANSVLNGPGTSPVELLAADPAAQFTSPNLIGNRFVQLGLSADLRLDDALSLQGGAYYSYFQQRVVNGNLANDAPCGDGSGLLCAGPGMPSTTRGGLAIPDFLDGGPYSVLNDQTTNTSSYGASAQFTDTGELAGLANHLVAGASFDGAATLFSATDLIGGLDAARGYFGPGVVLDEPGHTVPVRVAVTDGYVGLFASDTLNLTTALAVTASGRLNLAEIDLRDEGGGALTGNHSFRRFDPAAGATYAFGPVMTVYVGYSEANRAPTPAELSCAGPADTCTLANFFVGDPNLRQVVAHTVEAGLRGHTRTIRGVRLGYDLSLFHTVSDDDIIFVNSVNLGRAYFTNIGQTRRQGGDIRLDARGAGWSAYAAATYTEATFQSIFVEAAGNNPAADLQGNLTVRPGAALPGVPWTTFKFGADVSLTSAWHVGFDSVLQSGQYLFGDEPNLTPKLPGFVTINLHTSYQITPRVELFGSIRNLTDARTYSYGTFSPTSSVFLSQAPGASNPRAYSVAAPVGGFGGMRLTF